MKTGSLIWAIFLAIFGLLCAIFYFVHFYWHLGLFAGYAFLLSIFMYNDYKRSAK